MIRLKKIQEVRPGDVILKDGGYTDTVVREVDRQPSGCAMKVHINNGQCWDRDYPVAVREK